MTARKRRGCRHDPDNAIRHLTVYELTYPRIHLTCGACNEWLPLGPSNDSPEAVRVEIRAAELACLYAECRSKPPIEWCDFGEWLGWENDRGVSGPGWDCGYLARCIHDHDHGAE